MDNNSNHQLFFFKGKSSSSRTGIIGIALIFLGVLVFGGIGYLTDYMIINTKLGSTLGFWGIVFSFGGIFILNIIGLIKGIKELRLLPKNRAIAGIILCSFGLIISAIIGFWGGAIFLFLGT